MADTNTYAERQVAGGTLYLFKAPTAKKWQIRYWWRDLNVATALAEGVLRSVQRIDERYLRRKFSTPDDAALAVARILAA